MAIRYELMYTPTTTLFADFPTEAEALAAVREQIAVRGPDRMEGWAMARIGDDEADDLSIAEGDALAALALRQHIGAAD